MLRPKASPLFSPNTMDPEGFCLQGRECSFSPGQATGVWRGGGGEGWVEKALEHDQRRW